MAVLFNIKFKKSPKFSYWLEYGDRNYLTYKPTGYACAIVNSIQPMK